tara:strand:- start:439 stop:792 length:354 start_codon:yes stop_codon:yes gene_type:complete
LGDFGFTMTYSEKLRDPRWQRKRLEIMERDEWRCKHCQSTDKTLTVHHYLYCGNPWEVEDRFLATLCEDCHQNRQELDSEGKRSLAEISSIMGDKDFYWLVNRLDEIYSIKSKEVSQ